MAEPGATLPGAALPGAAFPGWGLGDWVKLRGRHPRNDIVNGAFACRPQDGYKELAGGIGGCLQGNAMSNLHRVHLFALGLLTLGAWACPAARSADEAGSKTIIGQSNSLLAVGAAALEAGRIEEGVRLTLEGLKVAVSSEENAAGHSNACAGYVLLRQWQEALVQCNAALALDTTNWRIYNNRAAIYVEKGLYDLAMRDLEAGLAIAPGAPTLHESVRILERNKRLIGRQGRKVLPS